MHDLSTFELTQTHTLGAEDLRGKSKEVGVQAMAYSLRNAKLWEASPVSGSAGL